MVAIGCTGGIGSGKSTVAALLERRAGAHSSTPTPSHTPSPPRGRRVTAPSSPLRRRRSWTGRRDRPADARRDRVRRPGGRGATSRRSSTRSFSRRCSHSSLWRPGRGGRLCAPAARRDRRPAPLAPRRGACRRRARGPGHRASRPRPGNDETDAARARIAAQADQFDAHRARRLRDLQRRHARGARGDDRGVRGAGSSGWAAAPVLPGRTGASAGPAGPLARRRTATASRRISPSSASLR